MDVSKKLKIRDIQLDGLFEAIKAINSNFPEADLYRIFKFIVSSNTGVIKMALYMHDDHWICKAQYAVEIDMSRTYLPELILKIMEPCFLKIELQEPFNQFNYVIPVKHKSEVLSYILLHFDTSFSIQDLEVEFIAALGNIIAVAVENKKLVRREQKQKEYKTQLALAHEVQKMLFPRNLPFNDQVKITASYMPHLEIGGDYYDYIELSKDEFLLCIADVSGKGIPAAILMSNFQAGLRTLSKVSNDLKTIVGQLNALVVQNARGENFITAFFLIYNKTQKTLTYINNGHNPPYFLCNGKVERLSKGSTILGGFASLPSVEVGILQNLSKFLFFAFTDGFTETYNEKGEEFAEAQIEKILTDHKNIDTRTLHVKLINSLNSFRGKAEYTDDITLLSCMVNLEP
jgi:sigma-B regulation protein RsbU (phosphoserine phosphatase)